MSAVLTSDQARQVTRGRTPLVPIEYETAVNALQACITMDDAKYWSDKADALAAWARIYRSDDAGRKARQLKLHAFRRMGILAQELRPRGVHKPGGTGTRPGPVSLMVESGLSLHQAAAASAIAKISKRAFLKAVDSEHPPAPSSMLPKFAGDVSDSWKKLAGAHGGNTFIGFRAFCRANEAKPIAKGLAADEVAKVRGVLTEINEWLDEFEQYLPKEKARAK